jgi:BolA family transcriptional regulator, general stress-responsive regulator
MITNEQILAQLASLSPVLCELTDDSHMHIGHAGAKSGGHYHLKIVAETFAGKTLISRHRLVYAAIGTLMNDSIHALSITALSPNELERT